MSGVRLVHARCFALPGVFYDQDLGWVITASAVCENRRQERYLLDFSFYQDAIGLVKLSAFLPRTSREWTFLTSYKALDYPGFSPQNPNDHSERYPARRRDQEVQVRCDFPRAGGFFWGLQTDFHRFEYRPEIAPRSPAFSDAVTFDNGEEYFGSLRVGLESRNNRYYTVRGAYLLWQLDLGATRSDDNTSALVRMNADVRRYIPVGWDMTILALNLRGGVIHHSAPYFSLFTLGGQYDLRGFPSDRYSGSAYYLARAEVRQTVIDSLKISMNSARKVIPGLPDFDVSIGFVLFTEGGDLWRDHHRRWWGFRQTAGAGLRFILPPSVVASLDFARPVEGGDLAFYLSLEQSF
jgi:hypothetical protein